MSAHHFASCILWAIGTLLRCGSVSGTVNHLLQTVGVDVVLQFIRSHHFVTSCAIHRPEITYLFVFFHFVNMNQFTAMSAFSEAVFTNCNMIVQVSTLKQLTAFLPIDAQQHFKKAIVFKMVHSIFQLAFPLTAIIKSSLQFFM